MKSNITEPETSDSSFLTRGLIWSRFAWLWTSTIVSHTPGFIAYLWLDLEWLADGWGLGQSARTQCVQEVVLRVDHRKSGLCSCARKVANVLYCILS